MNPLDLPLVAGHIAHFVAAVDASDLARFACVSRTWRAAVSSCSSVTARDEAHVAGAIALLGPALRELRLAFPVAYHEDDNRPFLTLASFDGLDALPPNTVVLHDARDYTPSPLVPGYPALGWNYAAYLRCFALDYDAMLDKPAVRELRLDRFSPSYTRFPNDEVAVNPRLSLVGQLVIDDPHVFRDLPVATFTRHTALQELILTDWSDMLVELTEGTHARHLVVDMTNDWECERKLAAEMAAPRVRRLTYLFADIEHTHDLLQLLKGVHTYTDGLTLEFVETHECEYNDDDGTVYARALAVALASPSLRVGGRMDIDTTFAVSSLATPCDALLGAIAASARHNDQLHELRLRIDGVPEPGAGIRAIFNLPAHVHTLTVEVYIDRNFNIYVSDAFDITEIPEEVVNTLLSNGRRSHGWLWDALAQVDLPGVRALTVKCHINGSGGTPAAFTAAGIAVRRGCPQLRSLTLFFERNVQK